MDTRTPSRANRRDHDAFEASLQTFDSLNGVTQSHGGNATLNLDDQTIDGGFDRRQEITPTRWGDVIVIEHMFDLKWSCLPRQGEIRSG